MRLQFWFKKVSMLLFVMLHAKNSLWDVLKNGSVYGGAIKDKDIPATGRGGPLGCDTSRYNRFTDDGEVVSLKRRLPFTPRKIPGTHFC
jgi:hypothetical protein